MTEDIKAKLEKAAEYIIETSARETTSGSYIMYPDDIPAEIIPPDLYIEHLGGIVKIMQEYEAVTDIEIHSGDALDFTVLLDYCPNFEPDADERDDYPDDREILDPLASRRVEEASLTLAEPKPTLMERLEAGKRKAAEHHKPDNSTQKSKKREGLE